jgi:hypothetical protein
MFALHPDEGAGKKYADYFSRAVSELIASVEDRERKDKPDGSLSSPGDVPKKEASKDG